MGGSRRRRFAIAALLTIFGVISAGFLFGPLAALVIGIIGFLGTAAACDDGLGTCLIWAVLVVIGLALLTMVFVAVIKLNTAGETPF